MAIIHAGIGADTVKPQIGHYRGRFAPSPTGPLHLGSLVAALGSYLRARQRQGEWLLRIEDLDQDRNQPGAVDDILRCLECHGFEWDGEPSYQQQRLEYYQHALEQLQQLQRLFYCTCTRKSLRLQYAQNKTTRYPGTCRTRLTNKTALRAAIRLRVEDVDIEFIDAAFGVYRQNLSNDVGDFVIRRADGFFAYQLAVVVDDAEQGITEVVRGADLLDNTPRQIYLQRLLNLPTPGYLHLPLVTNAQGEKLGKQTGAKALDNKLASSNVWTALNLLGQRPPMELKRAALTDLWQWAIEHWRP